MGVGKHGCDGGIACYQIGILVLEHCLFGTYQALAVDGGPACYLNAILDDVASGIDNNGYTYLQLSKTCCSITNATLLGCGHAARFTYCSTCAGTYIAAEW